MNDLTLIAPGTARRAHHRRDRRHDGLRRGGEGAGDPGGLRLGLARLRRLVRLQGRHSPASAPGIVAAYLSSLADSGRKASTIGRRAAAIGYHHKMAGHEPPTGSEAVKAVLRGIRRTIGSAKQGKAPATADLIGQMVALCPDNMIGKRDRALLCLGFAGAFRRSELCALEVADLTEVPDGLRILIRRSKGDQEGQGQEVAIPRGYRLRPVEAVQTWLAAAEISSGPVFRAVARGGKVSDAAAGGRQRGADREAVCPAGRARSGVLRRPQPAQRVPDVGGGERAPRSGSYRRSAGTRASTRCAATCGGSICSRNTRGRRSCERHSIP